MCIVIDPNCIPSVFGSSASDRDDFKPINQWISRRSGKLVYGGSKWYREFSYHSRYVGIIAELERSGRVVRVNDGEVDRLQKQLERRRRHKNFDDAHLVAILIVSRVMLVCTKDKHACRFLKDKTLYPNGMARPKIYSNIKHKHLIADKYLVGICRSG